MEYIINGRKPEQIFRFFEEIAAIPHGSGNEKGIADYLENFAKERGIFCVHDEIHNVFMRVPATEGRENEPAVLFQAHTDMVCEKNADTVHDFLTDPLELYLDGKYLRAKGTTLGADDGIGVTTMLALLDGAVASHPEIECLFTVSEETIELCRGIDVSTLSSERVYLELEKALTKSPKLSVFFDVLRKMNKLSPFFAELEALIGIKQNPKYHTEGDAYTHTMMVIDAAASFRDKVNDKTAFMLAATCHDLGKAVSTEYESGNYHAYGHEKKSVALADTLLRRLTNEKAVIKYVKNLTALHMKPNALAGANASLKSTNKMFDESIDPEALIYLGVSDGIGKLPASPSNEEFLFKRLDTFREIMARPFVTGDDLVSSGVVPSESFSEILSYAHKLRLAGVEKESALRQTLAYARKLKRN